MVAWIATWMTAAAAAPEDVGDALIEARDRHLRVQRAGMTVLGSWAAANLVGGSIGYALADTPRQRGFWGGNAIWNTVNLGIAAAALASIPGRRRAITDLRELEASRDNLERALLVNIGLDVAYVMAGFALRERGLRTDDRRLQGFGDALLVQGGFLFAFDIGVFAGSRRSRRQARSRTMP